MIFILKLVQNAHLKRFVISLNTSGDIVARFTTLWQDSRIISVSSNRTQLGVDIVLGGYCDIDLRLIQGSQ